MHNNSDAATDDRGAENDLDDDLEAVEAHARELVVVGIGASAGGLEALQTLVANLDPGSKMAFVVAQHVSADYRSMLVDLLSRHAVLEVKQAEDGQQLDAGKVYVCPPGYHITIAGDDRIRLSTVDDSIYMTKPSIDLFFKSLSERKGPRAIGVILSGTGSDGTSGVGAIKDVDGYSIAQEPATAKYDGMPMSAINSGAIDLVLAPEEIGAELAEISPVGDRPIPEFRSGANRDTYERILRLLKRDHGVNFSQYKDKTLSRRIMRRMIAAKAPTIGDYADQLVNDAGELNELFHDLLIGVTEFFRDTEAFNELRRVLEEYIESKSEPYLRVWSVGCSTGEEPYSIAILLDEILGERIDSYRIQIFATDVNRRTVDQARRGRFSAAAVANLSPELRDRYFVFSDGQFEVAKRIKQMVVFSHHDVIQDPPFLRQDLVVCRNLLIYFGNELQDTLLPVFHYVLHPQALLFLGQAESVSHHDGLWEAVSQSSKIFRSLPSVSRGVPSLVRTTEFRWPHESADDLVRQRPRKRLEAEMHELITDGLEAMLSPHVIVLSSDDRILFSHGEENPILQRQPGLSSDAVFGNIHPDAVVDLRTALHRLRAGEPIVTTDFRSLTIGKEDHWVRFVLTAAKSGTLGDVAIVYCQVEHTLGTAALDAGALADSPSHMVIEHEKQVTKLREQLAIVMEQLDNSSEEMQALNEELQSSNEELQSANEELETTNEELQSTNEELQTAYAELRIAFDEKASQETELELRTREISAANDLLVVAEQIGRTGSWRWRPVDESLVWSPGLHELLGTADDHIAPSFEKFLGLVHPADRAVVEMYIEQLLRGNEREPLAFRVSRNGTTRWLDIRSAIELGPLKQVVEVIGKVRDITDERLASELSRQQMDRIAEVEEQVQIVLNQSVNGVYVYDFATGSNDFLSESYTAILGWTSDDIDAMTGDEFFQLFHPDDRERIAQHIEQVSGLEVGDARTIRYRFRHKEGNWLELYGRDTVFEDDADGTATKMVGTFFLVHEDDD